MMSDNMTENEEIWWEDQPLSPKAQELTDVLEGMNLKDRAYAVLEMLSHDADVMQIVRVRMNWEIRNAVFSTLNKRRDVNIDQDTADAIYGQALFDEIDEVMPVLWNDEFVENTVRLDE